MSDAERYQFIKEHLAQIHSPKMDGSHSWRFRPLYYRGPTLDAALDAAMKDFDWKPPEAAPAEKR